MTFVFSMKNFLNSHFKIDISFTVAFVGFSLFTLNFIKLVKMDTPNNTRIKTTKLINLLKNGLKKVLEVMKLSHVSFHIHAKECK